MHREFRLAPAGSGRGVSCDVDGAFIESIPLLKRERDGGRGLWAPRSSGELSDEVGRKWGLPIDMMSKSGGLTAIARALNEGDVAKAQAATVLMAIPDQPPLGKSANARNDRITFIRELYLSNLIKADWNADDHPRWPAGAPDSQGGQFAPKGSDDATQSGTLYAETHQDQTSLVPAATSSRDDISRNPPGRKSKEECEAQLASDMYVCGSLRNKQERPFAAQARCRDMQIV